MPHPRTPPPWLAYDDPPRDRRGRPRMTDVEATIEALLSEQRVFEPPEAFRPAALVERPGDLRARRTPTPRRSGPSRPSGSTWFEPWDTVMEWTPALGEVVRRAGRSTSRTTAWTGTSRRAAATRSPTTGRASPASSGRSPTASSTRRSAGSPTGCRSLGVRQGRPRGHLPGHGARAARGHAGVRPDRGAALGRVRRVLRRGAPGPDQRRRGEGADHRRRRVSARARSCR